MESYIVYTLYVFTFSYFEIFQWKISGSDTSSGCLTFCSARTELIRVKGFTQTLFDGKVDRLYMLKIIFLGLLCVFTFSCIKPWIFELCLYYLGCLIETEILLCFQLNWKLHIHLKGLIVACLQYFSSKISRFC